MPNKSYVICVRAGFILLHLVFLSDAVAYGGKRTGLTPRRPESIPSSTKSPSCVLELVASPISFLICKMRRLNEMILMSLLTQILDDPQTSTC